MKQIIPPGYKKSPVGVIPAEWEVKHFGELASFKNGLNYVKENIGGSLKIIGVADFQNHFSIEYENLAKISGFEGIDESYLLKNGDILFVRSNGNKALIGRSLYIKNLNEKVTFSGFSIRARIREEDSVSSCYVALLCKTSFFHEQIMFGGGGSNISNLSQNTLEKICLAVPSLPEQQKIAAILATWDRAIQGAEQLLQTLLRRNKGLAQRLFAPKDGWKEVRLGEVFSERNETGFNDLELLSITGDRGVILQSENEKRDVSNTDKSKYKRICAGDIGYNTMRMWQGRSAISNLEGIVSPAYTIVVPNNEVDVEYMGRLFKQQDIVHLFFKKSQGLVDDTLNCKYPEFAKVVVKIPPLPEQRRIATLLATADREVALHERRLQALREQKRGLMQALLTGRIRLAHQSLGEGGDAAETLSKAKPGKSNQPTTNNQ